ncbi:isoprenylcysteine carboxylmethyltransferase family protein [Desulfopila sp. IMCC35006]|uniref:methyltransferase family protein n=1 Tax=Desulfopila sp. IMCC35006 TaxID=2569542 RepID=UPI0010AC5EFE|nr:methyltransferase [Desulfopila sp. IMCC35006]TKB25101.1 isoprenylcysteine carboxylmethyltransferase family protein [Desulfopila sp. IMCC35006]
MQHPISCRNGLKKERKNMNAVLLSILWIAWCTMHSILIDASILRHIKTHVPRLTRYYRLLYNGLSAITLVPLIIMTKMAGGPVVVNWEGNAVFVRVSFLVTALLLFRGGAQKYDLQYFLGLKQLQTGEEHLLLSEKEEFLETGVFGITRHPWYLGSLLFLWSMLAEYPLPVFLAVCILSVYLVIGTMLEERKIVTQYGERYRRYRQRVSMLFPWKWLVRLLR